MGILCPWIQIEIGKHLHLGVKRLECGTACAYRYWFIPNNLRSQLNNSFELLPLFASTDVLYKA